MRGVLLQAPTGVLVPGTPTANANGHRFHVTETETVETETDSETETETGTGRETGREAGAADREFEGPGDRKRTASLQPPGTLVSVPLVLRQQLCRRLQHCLRLLSLRLVLGTGGP